METKRLLFQHFDDGGDDNEELLNLSLSTPASLASTPLFPSNPNPKKRSFSQRFDGEEDHQELLILSLSIGPPGGSSSSPPPPALPSTAHRERSLLNSPSPNSNPNPVRQVVSNGSEHHRRRTPKPEKSETVSAPYPWATTRRARVHSL